MTAVLNECLWRGTICRVDMQINARVSDATIWRKKDA
jgi:hypothetical protein